MAEGRGEVSVLSMRSALRDLNEGSAFTPLPRTPSFGGDSPRNSKEDLEVEAFKDLREERSDKGRIALKAVARTAATAFVLRDLPGQVRQGALPTFGLADEGDDDGGAQLPGAVPSPVESRKETGQFGVDSPRSRAGDEDPHLDDPVPLDDPAEPSSASGAPPRDAGNVEQTDHLLHWWCQKQMARCLRRLVRHPQAGPFAEPLPWEELGLDDYPEVVTEPMDLQTIEELLNNGGYDDDDGLINPEYFWEDVSLCWDNCLRYYEGDEDVEAYQMASEMREFAEDLEDEFWEELDRFENSINQVDPALSSLAAAADVAASAVEDAAATAYEEGGAMVQDLAYMLRGLLGGWAYDAKHPQAAAPASAAPPPPPAGTVPKKRPPMQIGPAAHRAHLLEHYRDLLEHFFDDCDVHVAIKDLQDIETDIDEAFNTDWPEGMLPNADNVEDDPEAEADALAYEGSAEKVAVEKLLPAEFLARATQAGLYPPRRVTARSPPGSARGSGASSIPPWSRRTSRAGSRSGSRVGSRRASRDRVPRLPLHSARSSKASSRSGGASIRTGTSSAPISSWEKLRGVGAKGAAALVAGASADHSDDGAEEQAKPKVSKENLKRMLPRSRRAHKANGVHVGDEDAPMVQSVSAS